MRAHGLHQLLGNAVTAERRENEDIADVGERSGVGDCAREPDLLIAVVGAEAD